MRRIPLVKKGHLSKSAFSAREERNCLLPHQRHCVHAAQHLQSRFGIMRFVAIRWWEEIRTAAPWNYTRLEPLQKLHRMGLASTTEGMFCCLC
jgi:hypothetical protein